MVRTVMIMRLIMVIHVYAGETDNAEELVMAISKEM